MCVCDIIQIMSSSSILKSPGGSRLTKQEGAQEEAQEETQEEAQEEA